MRNIIGAVLLIIIIIFSGCNKKEEELLDVIENVLPGKWEIESFQMQMYNGGIYYQGNVIYSDTILYDLGTIKIPIFSTDSLHLGTTNVPYVKCEFVIDDTLYNCSIERLFMSTNDYFVYLRQKGTSTLSDDTESARFVISSRIFNNNAIIKIENENKLKIIGTGSDTDNIIVLRRI